ncbi:hypothetical protein [Escherichia phage phiA2-1]|nr:hypothetical protein [Escherichia phage phiA2-1]
MVRLRVDCWWGDNFNMPGGGAMSELTIWFIAGLVTWAYFLVAA